MNSCLNTASQIETGMLVLKEASPEYCENVRKYPLTPLEELRLGWLDW